MKRRGKYLQITDCQEPHSHPFDPIDNLDTMPIFIDEKPEA